MEAAASIAGLIALADIVFGKVFRYIKTAKKAEKDVASLSTEIRDLSGILYSLQLVAKQMKDEGYDRSIRIQHVQHCHDTLETVRIKLQKAFPDSDKASTTKELYRKMKWPFSASETQDLIAEIQRHKSTLTVALSSDSLSSLLKALSKQDDIATGINEIRVEIRNHWERATRVQVDKDRRKVLEFFSQVDPRSSHTINLKLRHPATGLW